MSLTNWTDSVNSSLTTDLCAYKFFNVYVLRPTFYETFRSNKYFIEASLNNKSYKGKKSLVRVITIPKSNHHILKLNHKNELPYGAMSLAADVRSSVLLAANWTTKGRSSTSNKVYKISSKANSHSEANKSDVFIQLQF